MIVEREISELYKIAKVQVPPRVRIRRKVRAIALTFLFSKPRAQLADAIG